MKKEEFIKCMAYLGIAYNKEYSKIEVEQHYEFLGEYSYEVLKKAIKNIVKTSKFLPKINELIEECEDAKKESRYEIIEEMKNRGYFKTTREYEKATNFLRTGIIPRWFAVDMVNFKNKIIKGEDRLFLS